jgi:hypothetical protein
LLVQVVITHRRRRLLRHRSCGSGGGAEQGRSFVGRLDDDAGALLVSAADLGAEYPAVGASCEIVGLWLSYGLVLRGKDMIVSQQAPLGIPRLLPLKRAQSCLVDISRLRAEDRAGSAVGDTGGTAESEMRALVMLAGAIIGNVVATLLVIGAGGNVLGQIALSQRRAGLE